ncbi:MAG: HipA domain-containing protein [Campylobacterales bacterium]|nr:HipA domain-containing protein [Campylobacterales bacterium]
MNTLEVHLSSKHVGTLSIDAREDLYRFEYSDAWKSTGYPISPHLPFDGEISSGSIRRFLENLLPEGKGLDDLTTFTHISKHNIYALIKAIGFETSGALSFGERDAVMTPEFRPISEEELAARIDEIESKSIIIWDQKQRLSLSGVQEKLPVMLKGDQIGLADGSLSSTHILKFQTKRNEHIVINEYFCMTLAKAIALPVANVELKRYGAHPVLMVERFDRIVEEETIRRVHVIDGCQLLDMPSAYKYERNFGSGRDVKDIREGVSFSKLFQSTAMCQVPAKAKLQLLEWALFNLIIGNADAHGKNISFYLGIQGLTVAPYYDMLSILMHEGVDHELAMAFGDEFDADKVVGYPLRAFASDTGLHPKLVSERLMQLCRKVEDTLPHLSAEGSLMNEQERSFITDLQALIGERTKSLKEAAKEMLKVSF